MKSLASPGEHEIQEVAWNVTYLGNFRRRATTSKDAGVDGGHSVEAWNEKIYEFS